MRQTGGYHAAGMSRTLYSLCTIWLYIAARAYVPNEMNADNRMSCRLRSSRPFILLVFKHIFYKPLCMNRIHPYSAV